MPLRRRAVPVLLATLLVLALPAQEVPMTLLNPSAPELSRALTGEVLAALARRPGGNPLATTDLATPQAFRVGLAQAGLDVVDLAEAAFKNAAAAPAAQPTGPWTTRETGWFTLAARPGTLGHAQLDFLTRELTAFEKDFIDLLGLESRLRAARASLRNYPTPGLPASPGPARLVLRLHPDRQGEGAVVPGHTFGIAHFGLGLVEGNLPRLEGRADVLYHGPLSLAVLQHEAAHLLLMLAAARTEPLAAPIEAKEAALRVVFNQAYRPLPAFVNEGVADYGFLYAGMYSRWGLAGRPEVLAQRLLARDKVPSMDRLAAEDGRFHARNHKTFSLLAATFHAWLAERQGRDKLLAWITADGTDAVTRFQHVFGQKPSAFEAEWRAWLAARADQR